MLRMKIRNGNKMEMCIVTENNIDTYRVDPSTGHALEDIMCSTCKIATTHLCLGEDMPKDLRWKCIQCDEFTIKRGRAKK